MKLTDGRWRSEDCAISPGVHSSSTKKDHLAPILRSDKAENPVLEEFLHFFLFPSRPRVKG